VTLFSTNKFQFDLPGDGWVEQTIHIFHAPDDQKTGFVITRFVPEGPGEDRSIEASFAAIPAGLWDDREIVRTGRRSFGTVDCEDVSFVTRIGAEARYFRVVTLPHYGRELSFQWVGHAAAREQIDRRVEHTLDSIRFWSRS